MLNYLGVTGGLMGMAKNLVLCKIGYWSESVGHTFVSPDELRVLFKNNKTVESLMVNKCKYVASNPHPPPLFPSI